MSCLRNYLNRKGRSIIMKRSPIAIIISILSVFAFSACTASSPAETETQPVTTAQTTITTAETVTTGSEVSYMEMCLEKLVEMPPEEILKNREGVIYPEFEKFTYYSQTAERDTPVNVLLPTNYSEDKKYPVLYILHGYYDNEDWMARDIVHISTMLTNLVADGDAKEMIVVGPYIFCKKDMR